MESIDPARAVPLDCDIDQDQLTDLAAPAAMRRKAEELSAELQELEGTQGKANRMQWHVTV